MVLRNEICEQEVSTIPTAAEKHAGYGCAGIWVLFSSFKVVESGKSIANEANIRTIQ
ncbi:MAG: hypothetical protein ACON5D_17445 [Rubripirellula sp.]